MQHHDKICLCHGFCVACAKIESVSKINIKPLPPGTGDRGKRVPHPCSGVINHSTESIPPLGAGHENSRSQPLTRHCATVARAWGWAGYRLTRAAPWLCVAKVPSDPCKTTLFCADSHQESNQRHHARFVRQATRGRFSGEQWIEPKRLNQIKVNWTHRFASKHSIKDLDCGWDDQETGTTKEQNECKCFHVFIFQL